MRKDKHLQNDLRRHPNGRLFLNLTLIFSIIFACACHQKSPVAETANANAPVVQPSISPEVSPSVEAVKHDASQEIEFKSVKVRNYISQISTIKGIEKEATPLEGNPKDYKPDFVRPRHISLQFKGEYAENIQLENFPTEINIYPIKEFRQAFAESIDLMESFDEEINTLRKIISQTSPQSKAERFPFLLFFKYSPVITVHPKNISFKSGRGTSYISQFAIEPSAISNGELTYVFQGITNDEKYYISAFFPVRAKSLNEKDLRRKFLELKLPIYGLSRQESAISSVQNMLNKQKADAFEPNLNEIEKTISSLEVN